MSTLEFYLEVIKFVLALAMAAYVAFVSCAVYLVSNDIGGTFGKVRDWYQKRFDLKQYRRKYN